MEKNDFEVEDEIILEKAQKKALICKIILIIMIVLIVVGIVCLLIILYLNGKLTEFLIKILEYIQSIEKYKAALIIAAIIQLFGLPFVK